MNFSKYKDAQDFLRKTGMTPEEARIYLDKELAKLEGAT